MTAASLDDLRLELAPALAGAAVWDGWSEAAVRAAAEGSGIDPDAALYAFKDGPMAMIAAWIARVDVEMEAALPPELAIVVGAITLVIGVTRHGDARPLQMGAAGIALMSVALMVGHGAAEALFTIAGVALLGWAHIRNLRHSC